MITFKVEVEQEEDGGWLAEVLELPGVLAYGQSQEAAVAASEHFLRGCTSAWPSTRPRRVLAALPRIEWVVKRQSGSHRTLSRTGWTDVVFAFHEDEEIGPRMLARIARRAGLRPGDL